MITEYKMAYITVCLCTRSDVTMPTSSVVQVSACVTELQAYIGTHRHIPTVMRQACVNLGAIMPVVMETETLACHIWQSGTTCITATAQACQNKYISLFLNYCKITHYPYFSGNLSRSIFARILCSSYYTNKLHL